MGRLVDLSHPLVAGEKTYQWMPAPAITEYLSRDDSRERYAPGTEFAIHRIEMIGNSGTYIDSPFHRYADGIDLAELPLERIASLPGIVVRAPQNAGRSLDPDIMTAVAGELHGAAVLFHTGRDRLWGQPGYPDDAPFISRGLAELLRARGVALVGIDALNADDTGDLTRRAHSILLGAGIPIVENLCRLEDLPDDGFRFTAVPVPVRGCSSFPVRAYAEV